MQSRVLPLLLFGATKVALIAAFSSESRPCRKRGSSNGVAFAASLGSEILLREPPVHNTDDSSDGSHEDAQRQLSTLSTTMEIKQRLLDLLPRMMGTPDEFKDVESYVNTLEGRYTPVQTLGFLNLAMAGEWQLLFSTNLSGLSKPNFRIREMYQDIQPNDLNGMIVTKVTWDLAENGQTFDASGSFTIKSSYSINKGSRMVMDLEDHVLELAKGSIVPKDVQALVGMVHRAIPKELFDPNDHAMDTTYLDGNLRIVRMTGPRFEAVRDIFIRRGSREIHPM